MIEHCVGCSQHNWNNRHDEEKYRRYADLLAEEINVLLEDSQVLINMIPNELIFSDMYNQLMRQEDGTCHILPRIGAFEVSAVLNPSKRAGSVLFFSKLQSKCWPHFKALAQRIHACFKDYRVAGANSANDVAAQFMTSGQVTVRKDRRNANGNRCNS